MGTTLTKPVLLDETGQEIVGKLDEIKTAIGGTGEFVPIMIKVTTPPTKTNYYVGDTLDLSGIVVTLYGSNGGMYDITGDCIFSPADGASLSTANTSVSISYTWYKDNTIFTTSQKIVVDPLIITEIEVVTPPTKTSYFEGQTLDLTGIKVNANYSDGSSVDVTSSCIFSPADGSILNDVSINTISISYTNDGTTYTTSQSISVNYEIYGVEWDGSANSAFTRTDAAQDFTDPVPSMSDGNGGWTEGSSPFDNILPWSGMTLGAPSTYVRYQYFVKIPKYYYKWTSDGAKLKLQISPKPLTGFHVSPAHADRGDGQRERDYVYIARFVNNGSSYPSPNDNTYSSNNLANERTAVRNFNYQLVDYAMFWTVNMLYLVEYGDWNCQKKLGYGVNSTNEMTNKTGSMPYHTGTTATSLQTIVNGTPTYGHVQYRHIEDLWGKLATYIEGIYLSGKSMYCIKNPSNFGQTSGGQLIADLTDLFASSSYLIGNIKAWNIPSISGYEYALSIADKGGDSDEYVCDQWYLTANYLYWLWGGGYNTALSENYGLFYLQNANSISGVSSAQAYRSMILPANS